MSTPRPAVLHGYFRSVASWRVRIALALKGLTVHQVSHHLRRGEQRSLAFLQLNPQSLVPALELSDGMVLTQSLAIVEWLDEAFPSPALLPTDPVLRALVRAFALVLVAGLIRCRTWAYWRGCAAWARRKRRCKNGPGTSTASGCRRARRC